MAVTTPPIVCRLPGSVSTIFIAVAELVGGAEPDREAQRWRCFELFEGILQGEGYDYSNYEEMVGHESSGRPFLRGVPGRSISISHDGPWCAVAYTPVNVRIGVDIQCSRPVSWRLRQLLAPKLTAMGRLEAQFAEFAWRWACRESVAKSLGVGMRGAMVATPLPIEAAGVEFGVDYQRVKLTNCPPLAIARTRNLE